MARTKEDLEELLVSFKEALEFWISCFRNEKEFSKIKAAEVTNPFDEFLKLISLIRAHTTKVGIVFKPHTWDKEPEAAFNALESLSKTVVFLLSLCSQLKPTMISQLFHTEVIDATKSLIDSIYSLSTELLSLVHQENTKSDTSAEAKETSQGQTDDESDIRLISVGKIWSNCDALEALVKGGSLGVLAKKLKQSLALVNDGLDEFEEWSKDPDAFEDDDDPFGFDSDSDSDESNDEEKDRIHDNGSDTESLNNKPNDKVKLQEFAQLWLSKIKLIKLLLSSLAKSLPSSSSENIIDAIHESQKEIVSLIDKLIVTLMLDKYVDDDCVKYTKKIETDCKNIIKMVESASNGDEKKIRWCQAWNTKFSENI
ncbi:Piso0_004395 [Millerozyma farinosa CBS 7064]|uniref:Piso0_004395 protein n=1 Tax=Pichia sorbitophila (strain ATCC MYA-4447 / BCRC 22081 / CBS 7064 / NBRC 10061 / NRRL Y-12695) TaxID=559304 RepID=G8Y8P2_PICSO|nr:Piso0_004395 [Millerozyma farinosa CBS 7064]CCE84837.1 Piso0_004395 [Millerozyma farinosa CBS 7064]